MSDLTIVRGDTRVLFSTVRDETGAIVDLTGALAVDFTIRPSSLDDPVITKAIGDGITIPNPPDGIIRIEILDTDTVDLYGKFLWDLQLTDASSRIATVDQGVLNITADVTTGEYGPLVFLRKPTDYDAIRMVLGLTQTEIDVEDAHIEGTMFGQQAEAYLKAQIPDWEMLITPAEVPPYDPTESLFQFRTAATYLTASYIAETLAKGGFMGLMQPNGNRSVQEWDSLAEVLRGRSNEWIGIIDAGVSSTVAFFLPTVLTVSPRDRGTEITPYWGVLVV